MISNLEKFNDLEDAKRIFNLLNAEENEVVCLFVGGCVRDLIFGKELADIDFATSLTPLEIKKS